MFTLDFSAMAIVGHCALFSEKKKRRKFLTTSEKLTKKGEKPKVWRKKTYFLSKRNKIIME